MFSVILYTHVPLDTPLLRFCHEALDAAIDASASTEACPPERILVSSEPLSVSHGWSNIIAKGSHGLNDCYVKIATALAAASYDLVYLTEYDVLYPPGYFDYTPPKEPRNGWWYNSHVFRQNRSGFWYDCTTLTSQLCAHRLPLHNLFQARLAKQAAGQRIVWDEPGRDNGDAGQMLYWRSAMPTVDIRWGGNLTGDRSANRYLQELAPWGRHDYLWARYGLPVEAQPPPKPAPQPQPRLATPLKPDGRFL